MAPWKLGRPGVGRGGGWFLSKIRTTFFLNVWNFSFLKFSYFSIFWFLKLFLFFIFHFWKMLFFHFWNSSLGGSECLVLSPVAVRLNANRREPPSVTRGERASRRGSGKGAPGGGEGGGCFCCSGIQGLMPSRTISKMKNHRMFKTHTFKKSNVSKIKHSKIQLFSKMKNQKLNYISKMKKSKIQKIV